LVNKISKFTEQVLPKNSAGLQSWRVTLPPRGKISVVTDKEKGEIKTEKPKPEVIG